MLAALLATLTMLASAAPPPVGAPAQAVRRPDPVILISLDGFRADYLKRGVTPTLSRLAREGAWARDGMRPSFPSLTFPNHYTLVTGLRPDHHGIVNNTIEDASIPENPKFSLSNVDANADGRWWSQGEPIWITAGKAGLRTATVGWPGSEARLEGRRPDHFAHYDFDTPYSARVDTALAWMGLPAAKRPDLLTLYLDEPDHTGHEEGPDSAAVTTQLRRVDAAVARLIAGLKAENLYARTNLVIVADHGMAPVRRDQILYLDDIVDLKDARMISSGAAPGIVPRTAAAEAELLKPRPHLRCWRKGELPPEFHYGASPRVPPIVCLADVGWGLFTREAASKWTRFSFGQHGFDPASVEMRALFIAHGPAVRPGARTPVFDNVDVHAVLGRLLGIALPPDDGSPAVAARVLR